MIPVVLAAATAAFVAFVATAEPPATTPGLPAQVKVVDGAFRTQQGDPLYTFRNDTMFGMSHCFGACAAAWPPLLAPSPAPPQPGPDWTLVTREPGVKQWAYKDKPLYRANVPVERVEAAVKDGMWVPARP